MSTAAPIRPAPWRFAAPWGARGYVGDIDGPVHWIEFTSGDSPDGTPIVFVHGLGGSHLNWCLIWLTGAARSRWTCTGSA
jgi:pimeloyl-ACP methyl ester carboxylesterase